MRWMIVVLVACGAPATPPPTPRPASPKSAPQPITCSDAAVILRGTVLDERAAGPMKEEAIARACLHDRWPAAVITCVGGDAKPVACLDSLAKEQRTAYRVKLERWHEAFPDETVDVAADDELLPDVFIDCATAIGDVAQYVPPLALRGQDLELALVMRRNAVRALCNDWAMPARRCFETQGPATCRGDLPPDQQQDLTDRLAEIDALMKRIAALAKPPTCAEVVKAHYADAHWKGRLDTLKPVDRKKVIAESRTRMQKACTDDKWSAALRGCLVATGGDACFLAGGITAETWGFPASGVAFKTGIPECDAYGDMLRALTSCNQIPKQAAQTMLDNYQRAAPFYAGATGKSRSDAANTCKLSEVAIRESASSLGCVGLP